MTGSAKQIHFTACGGVDCFATLAMTKNNNGGTIMSQGKRIVLASRPVGEPKPSDFRLEECAVPTPGAGEVLLRTIWLSLDPYMRGRMNDGPSYAQPVPINGVMEGGTVSEVVASNNPSFAKGDIVLSRAGWQTHAISDGTGLRKIDPSIAPISTAVGVLGMPGMTAYTGLLDIGQPKPGETVVVAAASGAGGSAVGQIALLNAFARIPVCGLISEYNNFGETSPKWAGAMMRAVLVKRLTIRGFIVSDFAARHADFLRDMSGWVREGKVKHKEFVTEGLDSAPGAFMGLLKGANFGKQLVRVGPDKA